MVARLNLVTGGAGFLGRHLVRHLVGLGERVRVLDPAARPADLGAMGNDVEIVTGSVTDPEEVDRAMVAAERVYHLAANAQLWARDPASFEAINTVGTKTVLEAAKSHSPERVIVTSSATILRRSDDRSPHPIDETAPRPPLHTMAGPYPRSKWLAEQACLAAFRDGLNVIIAIPTVPIGPDDPSLTPPTRLIADLLAGNVPAILEARMNWVAVEDVAAGMVLAAEQGQPGERYILGGENRLLSDVVAAIGRISGRPMPRRKVPAALAMAAARASELVARLPPAASVTGVRLALVPQFVDCTKARSQLGYAPGPVDDALARAVSWLTENPGGNREQGGASRLFTSGNRSRGASS